MSCEQCGSRCVGTLCAVCRDMDRVEGAVVDTELFECPNCGMSTSGPDVDCFRCRGGSE